MKLSLVVMTPGKTEGKVIPITLSQFVIGRDPQCHLRPASALISKRHCALLVRDGKLFLRDFDSTNGTFLNDQAVKGEVEVKNGDRLKVGPLLFGIKAEATATLPVNRPTPPPAPKAAEAGEGHDDDSIAAMLLSLQDDSSTDSRSASGDVPEGSTVMDLKAPDMPTDAGAPAAVEKDKEKDKKKAPGDGNTSSAAKAILEKYMKRPRGQ
jgi:predicted component of type VI protein secretion system